MYSISQLFIYPIKSLGGIEVTAAHLTGRGLQYDRRWMLVDATGQFLTQRQYPAMSLLQTGIKNDRLEIYNKNNREDKISLPLHPAPAATVKVKIWDDECQAQYVNEEADAWFANNLSVDCRLVYMPDTELRRVDARYARNNEITSFSDAYPLLMIGQASLDDLNSRLAQPLPMNRFRPNLVFTGGRAYDEDTMEHILVGNIDLYGVKLCSRCMITTTDQTTGLKEKEPLKTFAAYRRIENKVYFGQNMLFDQTGLLTVGDTIQIIQVKQPLTFENNADNDLAF